MSTPRQGLASGLVLGSLIFSAALVSFPCLLLSFYLFFCLLWGICFIYNRFDLFFPSFHDDAMLVGSQGGKLVYDYGIGVQRQGSAIEDKKAMWKDLSRHAE
jgi:hypothetical protein